jgi:asparagine synthase (glutamine-hydrolysing)
MCGIWGYLSLVRGSFSKQLKTSLYSSFNNIKHRGPDRSTFLEVDDIFDMYFGFHRLAIMDKSTNGDQPFVHEYKNRTIYCLCNGEIYNFEQLAEKYELETTSRSDCEILPLIYEKHGIDELLDNVKTSEYAFLIIDVDHKRRKVDLYAARDPCGVRPMFFGKSQYGIAFCSEMKGISDIVDRSTIEQFPPGTYFHLKLRLKKDNTVAMSEKFVQYYSLDFPVDIPVKISDEKDEDEKKKDVFSKKSLRKYRKNIRNSFTKSVESMLKADRPMGALLSGGLDSSLVVGIAARYFKENYGTKLRTFSIGMPGSTDGQYAQMVADHCDTQHTHIELNEEDFLKAIKEVVWAAETFDVTTVRATVGQYLASKWIAEHTDIKVLLIGDGSDELCSGYMYFHNAPSPTDAHNECCRLLKDIHKYDGLRADRGIAKNGLEARMPFLCINFIEAYMSAPAELRVPVDGIEKWLLRTSFADSDLLPQKVLFRRKEAFSDGVSGVEKSWHHTIQQEAEKLYSDEQLERASEKFKHCTPYSKESLYFRTIFNNLFGNEVSHTIPYFWVPKWNGDIKEPSARALDAYKS